jgi:hypothetical protein
MEYLWNILEGFEVKKNRLWLNWLKYEVKIIQAEKYLWNNLEGLG